MHPLSLPVCVVAAFITVGFPVDSHAQGEQGCRFFIGEVIDLISSDAENLSSAIEMNDGLVAELDAHHHGISSVITSFETVRYSSSEPDLVRHSLNFARLTERTNRAIADLVKSISNVLRNVHAGMEGEARILGMIQEKECTS